MTPGSLVLAGGGGEKRETDTPTEYGAKGPFTVEMVNLLCQDGPPSALVKKGEGKLYALNRSTGSKAPMNGCLGGQSIPNPNANLPGTKMDRRSHP